MELLKCQVFDQHGSIAKDSVPAKVQPQTRTRHDSLTRAIYSPGSDFSEHKRDHRSHFKSGTSDRELQIGDEQYL